ncbi:MAG: Type 1 glutamine amidotransferase-like domain-containing protein [Candidatus Sericytochromatia bacterium]
MKELYYLISGNIDPSRDTHKIHLDMIKETKKEKPFILLFATASDGLNWHNDYVKNITNIFSKYSCNFKIIDNVDIDFSSDLEKADIIYFLGGSPYKHSRLYKYKEKFKKVPIKAGTSAGAIYLGYETFFLQKDDYLISVPNMLNFVDIHVLPHSETHIEELTFNYLVNEAKISVLKIYNQACLKIEKNEDNTENIFSLMGETENSDEKLELILNNSKFIKTNKDEIINTGKNLIL